MKTKILLFPIVALLIAFLISTASANEITSNMVVSLKDVVLGTNNLVGYVGETVPVRVTFISNVDVADARIRVRMEGHREEIASSTRRLTLVANGTYTELMNLRLPSKIRDRLENYTLYVEVSSAVHRTERQYNIRMQRESYDLRILSVDYNLDASAGSTVPVMIVVKNTGFQRKDDVYVTVAVPELGISARAYLEDLVAIENCDENCDRQDSISKILNLRIPERAASGLYEMVITVHNLDTRSVERRSLKVASAVISNLIATNRNQDLNAGETKTYELVIVNSGNNIRTYTITTTSSPALEVSVPSIVSVAPQTAHTIPIAVRAKNNAEVGSYAFNIAVDGQQTSFMANVVRDSAPRGVLALTIILAIIFVALVILLIFLLFKREKKIEEVETSYY